MTTRNSEVLKSFVEYCEAHPQERFWQALRNWSGHSFVFVGPLLPTDYAYESGIDEQILLDLQDTFSWTERDH
jgi:hypothetical protein